jgi:Uma2 family endonuclease
MTGVTAAHARVSFADLERWPEDGRRYELYDGEVHVVPSPILLHQIAAGRLYLALSDYVTEHGGIVLFPPLDIVLTDYDVVQPDLIAVYRRTPPPPQSAESHAGPAGSGGRDLVAGHCQ